MGWASKIVVSGALWLCMATPVGFGWGSQDAFAGPIDDLKSEQEAKKSAADKRREKIAAELAEKRSGKKPRVIVLPWFEATYENEALRNNIRSRIRRPDAVFLPAIDLYQEGRDKKDGRRPEAQPAMVADAMIPRIVREAEATLNIEWDAMGPNEWRDLAISIEESLTPEAWFIDREELREPVFLLYAAIGWASDNADDATMFQRTVTNERVNWYYYLAASLAYQDEELLSLLDNVDVHESISSLRFDLLEGRFTMMPLDFSLDDVEFDLEGFASQYVVWIDGLDRSIDIDEDGLLKVPPGRSDVFLEVVGGYSLSARRESVLVSGKQLETVLYDARKLMGIDFKEQLIDHPNECAPQLDSDIVTYLAIYQKLHPASEIYVTVAEGGSVQPNKILLWRWDQTSNQLLLVYPDGPRYPVTFATQLGFGASFGGLSVAPPTVEPAVPGEAFEPPAPEAPDLEINSVPVDYTLRLHWNRLMIQTGMQFAAYMGPDNEGCENGWCDLYQNDADENQSHLAYTEGTDENGNGSIDYVLQDKSWQRLTHFGVGVMGGRNSAMGLGPYVLMRTGIYNVPHGWDLTLHGGVTAMAPFADGPTGRTNPLVTVNGYVGGMIPTMDTIYTKSFNGSPKNSEKWDATGAMRLNFGMTASAGLTF